MAKPSITQKRLKEYLRYCPHTGHFTWKRNKGGRAKKGAIAGRYNSFRKYVSICIDGKEIKAHRLAFLYMTNRLPLNLVDHIDGNPKNNSWNNLREVNHQDNLRNCQISKANSTGVTGVYWDKSRSKWIAMIKVNYIAMNLGRFNHFVDAVIARKMAEYENDFHLNHGRNRCNI